jgi:hypothetical protein
MIRRLAILAALALVAPSARAQEKIDPKLAVTEKDVLWYDVRHLDVEGKAWSDTKAPFDRLPAKAEGSVRDAVWGLSRHSAGLCVRFVTDAASIQARWMLTSPKLEMPHMPAKEVAEKTEPLVQTLQKARPGAAILLVEDRDYANGHLLPGPKERNRDSQAALKAAYQRLTKTGVNGVYYLRGADLLGDDNEGTVDSSHPTDLGFVRQADAFEKALRPLLKR